MTLRARLFALVSAAVAASVALVTWTISASARRSFAALDEQRAGALVAQVRHQFESEGAQVALRVERVAASDAVLGTAADLGRGPVEIAAHVDEAAALASAQGLDILDLVRDDGTILSSAHWPARFGYREKWTADRPTGGAAWFFQEVELPRETTLALVAVRRAASASRHVDVAGGRALDRKFLQALTVPPGMRVLLAHGVESDPPRQQLFDAAGVVTQSAQLDPLVARVRQSGVEAVETIASPDGAERVHAIPLAGPRGRVPGVLLVASSGRELAALVDRIWWSGAVFGGLGIAVGLLVSYAVAARVTRPVEQLADAARAVAGGRWDTPLDAVSRSGEIGALADAFETMTRQLVDERERVVQAERVAAWRELARRLAHELKNPLFPLRLTVDNLRRGRALPPPEFDEVFDESMTTLATGLTNLTTVIGGFSDFAKMPVPQFADVSPNAILEDAVRLFRAQLDAPGRPRIEVALDLDPAIGRVRADPEQLGRAMQNLLLNAIDAMPEGGTVTVRTRRHAAGVSIDVGDTGVGLMPEERQRLFTPYYTTKQHGTGLGLAIVQSVVADHSGRISVDSEPGRGTTFHIELPAS